MQYILGFSGLLYAHKFPWLQQELSQKNVGLAIQFGIKKFLAVWRGYCTKLRSPKLPCCKPHTMALTVIKNLHV